MEHERRLRSRQKREVGGGEKYIQRRLDKYPLHMDKFVASGFLLVSNTGAMGQTVDQIQQIIAE